MPICDLIDRLTRLPKMRQVPIEAAQAVLALRFCILCHRSDRDPLPELGRRWGNVQAAQRYQLVVEAVGQSWPEPFAVAPPCCPQLSFDEALLADMVVAVNCGNRDKFDRMTGEMLGADARALLYTALEIFDDARASGAA